MDDAVSHALDARTHAPEGLTKMLLLSVAVHILLATFASLAPASLWQRPVDARLSPVTIDLGPGAGQDTGGLTASSARPAKRAVATLPEVRPTRPPVVAESETAPGDKNAVTTETQATTNGLSTPSGVGAGVQVNVGDFCCPDYIATMVQRIHQHWIASSGTTAVTAMQVTIQRDGTLTGVRLARSSGNQMLDFLAQRALLAVRQLPPLPDAYTNPALTVSLEFKNQR